MKAFQIAGAAALLGLFCAPLSAAELTALVQDQSGQPLQHVVGYLLRADGKPIAGRSGESVVRQRESRFVPPVAAIYRDSHVRFSNEDATRHHVYSFSDAKTFETKLYSNEEAPRILFDKPGHVALGCNIHDWMSAHLLVLETPHYATSDALGSLSIRDIPPGEYLFEAWHPGARDGQVWKKVISLAEQPRQVLDVQLDIETPISQERTLSPLELKLQRATTGKQ